VPTINIRHVMVGTAHARLCPPYVRVIARINATRQSSLYAALDRLVVSLLAMTEIKPGNGDLHSGFFSEIHNFQ
jgi:hypothetical protein